MLIWSIIIQILFWNKILTSKNKNCNYNNNNKKNNNNKLNKGDFLR